jgi:hypothetical protein
MARKKSADTNRDESSRKGGKAAPSAGKELQGISKSEAARRALAAGYDNPQEALAYIKGQFGIDMGPQHFSTIKSSMKKGGAKPKGNRG